MKRGINLILILLFVLTTTLSAQNECNCKFGHIDTQTLLSQHPKAIAAQEVLKKETADLEEQLEVMQVEYNNKLNEYMENDKLPVGDANRWSNTIRKDKETELQGLGQRIQNFNGVAQQDLNNRRAELLQPIYTEVDAAIKAVGAENKFISVFETASLLYVSEEMIDITALVKTKLGIQ